MAQALRFNDEQQSCPKLSFKVRYRSPRFRGERPAHRGPRRNVVRIVPSMPGQPSENLLTTLTPSAAPSFSPAAAICSSRLIPKIRRTPNPRLLQRSGAVPSPCAPATRETRLARVQFPAPRRRFASGTERRWLPSPHSDGRLQRAWFFRTLPDASAGHLRTRSAHAAAGPHLATYLLPPRRRLPTPSSGRYVCRPAINHANAGCLSLPILSGCPTRRWT